MIIVIGHKNPDTDSVVAAMVFADYLNKKKMPARAAIAGELNNETKFILRFFKQRKPVIEKNLAGKKVFLIDHNEFAQGADGVEKAEIVGILDHHRLGGISCVSPIYFRNEPLGSSSTLVVKIFEENSIELKKTQAGLLLTGIISDTLKFTSPTTTAQDIKIAKSLAQLSKKDVNELAKKMFRAKSSFDGLSIKDILKKDYKEFEFSGKKIGIGVYETVSPETFKDKEKEILRELPKLKASNKIDYIFFAAVDIIKQVAHFYIFGKNEQEILEKNFKGRQAGNIYQVPGLVSRKKQIVPVLAKYFEYNYEA